MSVIMPIHGFMGWLMCLVMVHVLGLMWFVIITGKQLAVRVMPVLIHPQAYEMLYANVPGGKIYLPPPSNKPSSRGYAESWDSSRSFRQFVTDDFVDNYSKRMAKGRKVHNHKDRLGNVVGVVFDQQAKEGKGDEKAVSGGGAAAGGGAGGAGGDVDGGAA